MHKIFFSRIQNAVRADLFPGSLVIYRSVPYLNDREVKEQTTTATFLIAGGGTRTHTPYGTRS